MPLTAAMNLMPECALASSMASRVSLVNLQKFTLKPWLDPPSMKMLAPAQNTRSLRLVMTTAADFGMFEADALNGVGELDVDAEVVGVELEAVVVAKAAVLAHVHAECRDRTVTWTASSDGTATDASRRRSGQPLRSPSTWLMSEQSSVPADDGRRE